MNNLIKCIENYIDDFGIINIRDNKKVKEVFGKSFSINFTKDLINIFNESEENYEEYFIYKKMCFLSKDIFLKNFKKDKFSRRLIIQFPFDYHYKEQKDLMPCIESFCIFFVNYNEYILTINFRSSDILRLFTDIRTIYTLCIKDLFLNYNLKYIHINFFNLHKYL